MTGKTQGKADREEVQLRCCVSSTRPKSRQSRTLWHFPPPPPCPSLSPAPRSGRMFRCVEPTAHPKHLTLVRPPSAEVPPAVACPTRGVLDAASETSTSYNAYRRSTPCGASGPEGNLCRALYAPLCGDKYATGSRVATAYRRGVAYRIRARALALIAAPRRACRLSGWCRGDERHFLMLPLYHVAFPPLGDIQTFVPTCEVARNTAPARVATPYLLDPRSISTTHHRYYKVFELAAALAASEAVRARRHVPGADDKWNYLHWLRRDRYPGYYRRERPPLWARCVAPNVRTIARNSTVRATLGLLE
ncbi:unnamed protein product, partial [Iphiclides podalirius]